jgi:hypothetical protein
MVLNVAFSQNVVLSGYVTDDKTGEAIIGANILDMETGVGLSTNKFGFFTLKIKKAETHRVQFSFVGYRTKVMDIQINEDKLLMIALNQAEYNLNEVVVTSQRKIEERAETGKLNIPVSIIRNLPTLTGETDIMKAFQLMPGVQMGAENTNGLFVRGGSADQNLFLFDDVPLYNVNHLGGFFSVFDPSMLKSVDLYKGGFPARYGGRVSSVMDIRTKDGNLYSRKGEFALGILSSKLFLEGPVRSGKSSYALSVRYSNLGLYTWLISKMQHEEGRSGYYFYDINLKTNFILSPQNRLFLNFYTGDDNVFYKETNVKVESLNSVYSNKSDIKWGNTAGSVRWLHTAGNGFFNNTTLSFTGYRFLNDINSVVKDTNTKEKTNDSFMTNSDINDLTLKNDAEISFKEHIFRFGLSAVNHFFTTGKVEWSHSGTDADSTITTAAKRNFALDLSAYTEWEYTFLKKLSANAGFRTGLYATAGKTYPVFEPRIVLNYLFLPSFSFKTSYSQMHQTTHLLTNSDGGLPTDIWVPSTRLIKPETAGQFSFGLAHTTRGNYELSIDCYTKKMENLIDYKEGIMVYDGHQGWENKIETGGVGEVKGIEFLLQKKNGNLTGWLAYTLSSNKRRYEHLNNGKEFPYVYDQTHNLSLTGNYKISKKLTFSAVWTYHTGNHITLPAAKYQIANYDYTGQLFYSDVEIYSGKNGYRMPDYHRLDIGLNKTKPLGKGIRNWSINIYNIYNRQNAYFVFYRKKADGSIKLFQQSFFPILFNFSYSYKW